MFRSNNRSKECYAVKNSRKKENLKLWFAKNFLIHFKQTKFYNSSYFIYNLNLKINFSERKLNADLNRSNSFVNLNSLHGENAYILVNVTSHTLLACSIVLYSGFWSWVGISLTWFVKRSHLDSYRWANISKLTDYDLLKSL